MHPASPVEPRYGLKKAINHEGLEGTRRSGEGGRRASGQITKSGWFQQATRSGDARRTTKRCRAKELPQVLYCLAAHRFMGSDHRLQADHPASLRASPRQADTCPLPPDTCPLTPSETATLSGAGRPSVFTPSLRSELPPSSRLPGLWRTRCRDKPLPSLSALCLRSCEDCSQSANRPCCPTSSALRLPSLP